MKIGVSKDTLNNNALFNALITLRSYKVLSKNKKVIVNIDSNNHKKNSSNFLNILLTRENIAISLKKFFNSFSLTVKS